MDDFEALKLDNQLCFRLYTASHAVTRRYAPYLEPMGLTYTQYLTMLALWEDGETTVGGLCTRLKLETSTVTPLLKKLEAAGYVSRSRSAADERVCVVAPTEQGWKLRDEAAKVPLCLAADLGVDAELFGQLAPLLDRFIESVSQSGETREKRDHGKA